MHRRRFMAGALAAPFVVSSRAAAQAPVFLADMHFHSFFGQSIYHSRPVGGSLAEGRATLVAWALAGDVLWFDWRRGYRQHSAPKPGEALGWFLRELGRIKSHVAAQGLKLALTPADVERAQKGEPHVVLAVEGATFIDEPAHVKVAYDAGIRHLQLVHYIRSPLGDFQTQPPEHNGLTALGREVVKECNRLGILVDLAHCSPATVRGALAVSKVPMVWSHGSVTTGPAPHPGLIIWKARQLALADARAIARAGGVVGLWGLSLDVGSSVEAYAGRMLQMADWLGDQHVGFGSDINGLGPNATIKSYSDLRHTVEIWQRRKAPDARIRGLAGDNYARVLKAAMGARAI